MGNIKRLAGDLTTIVIILFVIGIILLTISLLFFFLQSINNIPLAIAFLVSALIFLFGGIGCILYSKKYSFF